MARPLPSRGDIVACLRAQPRALHAREIATRCKVPERAYGKFLQLLNELSFDGTLRRFSGNRFQAQRETKDTPAREGLLSVHPRGFGFVSTGDAEDVYIAPDGIGGALHGDRVVISVIGRSPRGVEGRIEGVRLRRNARVAGILRKRRRSAWLEPDDARLRGPIVLSSVPPETEDGVAAVATITRFPEALDENPEGELLVVLGKPGDAQVEVAKILVREQIVEQHPDAAIQEAEAIAAKYQRLPVESRRDLRELPLLTIDPVDARDHDDAVYAENRGNGYRVWVAIADVSEYVLPRSALDLEAETRGVTIYLPDRAIPMLPTALASDICSLLPERERLCLCVVADLDQRGSVERFEIVEGVMRAAAMISYNSVARALGFSADQPKSPSAEAFKRELKVLDEASRKLRRKRLRRGALDFDLPEAQIEIDDATGVPTKVTRRARDPGVKRAYQIIEELMILANELVAQWLAKRQAPAIYRVHAKPDEQKLERLGRICEILGAPFDLDDLLEPKGLARWLAAIQEHPRRFVLEMLLLRSMKQAVYDIANIGHFGLASDAYLHFTSPIRRYPDIEVHRSVKSLLRGQRPDMTPASVQRLQQSALQSTTRERAAMEVEREVVDLYRALYMRDHIGDIIEGTVSAITGTGIYVTLDDPFVDVLVRFESLGPDHYEASDDELRVVGVRSGDEIMLGERLTVTIEDVAILRRSVLAKRVVPEKALREIKPTKGRGSRKRPNATGQRNGKQRRRARPDERPLPARKSKPSRRRAQRH